MNGLKEPAEPTSGADAKSGPMKSAWMRKLAPLVTLAVLHGRRLVVRVGAMKEGLTNSVETTLAVNFTAMTIWCDDQKVLTSTLAQDPRVRVAVDVLIARRVADRREKTRLGTS